METAKTREEAPMAEHKSKPWVSELVDAYPKNIIVQRIIAPTASHMYL